GLRSRTLAKILLACCQRSGSIPLLLTHLATNPRFGYIPIASYRIRRDLQYLGYLFVAQTAKKAQFDHLTPAWINSGEALERLVECDQLARSFPRQDGRFVQRDLERAATSFGISFTLSVSDQDAPHYLRSDSKEVRPVLPLNLLLVDKPEIR